METIEYNFTCFVTITVKDRQGGLGTVMECLQWSGLPFELRQKWDWYFKYRAALLQVQYPKSLVDMRWGNEPKTDKEAIDRRNAIASKKRIITKVSNAITEGEATLNKARQNWRELFPIEQHKPYIEAQAILTKYRAKVERTKTELITLTQSQHRLA